MTVVGAAVCPHPPLLVPAVAAGAAAELDALRDCCDAALTALLETEPDLVLVVGAGEATLAYSGADSGSFEAFGVAVRVGLGPALCGGRPILPVSLTVGAWLLRRTGWPGERAGFAFGPGDDAALDLAASETLSLSGRVALLVMADGTACRSATAPGAFDPRAAAFDETVATALGHADVEALGKLDPSLAADLWVGGRLPWAFLARVAAGTGQRWGGRLLAHQAPYGVGYFVASWLPE
ncbi:MAG: class III extradiol dioxygenase subunit B-like domain-containing protein [Mycobacteriales bacterium]